MLFSLLKHYLDTDTALKVSQSVYCFTTSICHGVENYLPRLWGTGISDAIFPITVGLAVNNVNILHTEAINLSAHVNMLIYFHLST